MRNYRTLDMLCPLSERVLIEPLGYKAHGLTTLKNGLDFNSWAICTAFGQELVAIPAFIEPYGRSPASVQLIKARTGRKPAFPKKRNLQPYFDGTL